LRNAQYPLRRPAGWPWPQRRDQVHATRKDMPMQASTNPMPTYAPDLPRATHIYVYLADNEWGNETMGRVAEQIAREHHDKPNLLITVYEHGGWFLEWFVEAPGKLVVVGTTNDMARFPKHAESIRFFLGNKNVQWERLPSIRRD
jgi:hypothetical protein